MLSLESVLWPSWSIDPFSLMHSGSVSHDFLSKSYTGHHYPLHQPGYTSPLMPLLGYTHGPSPLTDKSLMLPPESLTLMPSWTHAFLTDSIILQTKLHLSVLASLVLAAILLGRGAV